MPVISSRRYSSSTYLTPSTTTSSSVGSYRSNYSSTSTSTSRDLPSTTSRYNFNDTSYRSTYRPSLTSNSGISSSTSSYRSRYDYDETDKKKYTPSSSLSTRIGVSSSRYNSDTLPPLPPTASSSSSVTNQNNAHNYALSNRSLSRSRDQNDSGESNGVGSAKNGDRSGGKVSLMNDLDFYEKYSPSRYMTKYELSRSRSLSETAPTPTRDKSPSNIETPTHTPKSEVCRTKFPSPCDFSMFHNRPFPATVCRLTFH